MQRYPPEKNRTCGSQLRWSPANSWRVGVYLDDTASDSQAEQLGAVLSGQLGGPPALVRALFGGMLGVEKARITYSEHGLGLHVMIGATIHAGDEYLDGSVNHRHVQLGS